MVFHSILFARTEDAPKEEPRAAPDFFVDLNLDQIIDAVTAAKQEYDLKPFFYTSLADLDGILYRQEIFLDLENPALFEPINAFAKNLREMREHLAQAAKLYYKHQRESWFLDAVEVYCDAVNALADDLMHVAVKSRGLTAFREYVAGYVRSQRFTSLLSETKALKADLSTVAYCVLIKEDGFKVRKYEGESDYSVEVEETFEKFEQGAVKDYRVGFSATPDMNHIEAKVLEFVALLHPDVFSRLDAYCATNTDYLDDVIGVFDREIQFYVGYLEYLALFRRVGLPFCYPRISPESKEVCDYEGFDLALARRLVDEKAPVVCNDFYLQDKERVLVVSGPNQGGKTTFARTFGQLHYLAGIGCPVPGRKAKLFLSDRLFTHFEKEESIYTRRGKLEDDLVRIHHVLNQATSRSVIIMNEMFTSTTLKDQIALSRKVMARIIQADVLCVWVTFIDELASFGERTVSMVSTIVADHPALRTFRIVRRPADGLAYALAIAEKYRLTYEHLQERVKP